MSGEISQEFLNLLVCPCDASALESHRDALHCAHGHRFSVVDGIPILLNAEVRQLTQAADASLRVTGQSGAPLYIETISEPLRERIMRSWSADAAIDAVISHLVAATSGLGYKRVAGRISEYPIPDIPFGPGGGKRMLDIGCGWGRWCVSAARKGWSVVGIDPSFGALAAARRAFSSEGLDLHFVCGDARHLPFAPDAFDAVHSYSVLQHFSKADVAAALHQAGRVLKPGGDAKIQMAHAGGVRSIYHRLRRSGVNGPFGVRYWTLRELDTTFEKCIGPSRIEAAAFGGLGLLAEDWKIVTARAKALILISERMKRLSLRVPPLIRLADSVFVISIGYRHSYASHRLRRP